MTNKQKNVRLLILGYSLFLPFFLFIMTTESGLAVSVKPILPENQHDPEATYYDLRMKPSQEQELKLEVSNTSDEERKLTIQLNDATTNFLGDIDYTDRSEQIQRDKSLTVSFKDIAAVESQVVISAHEKKIIPVHLKMPKEPFDGMVLGGIKLVSTHPKPTIDNQNRKNVYIVAVKLTETDTLVQANLNLLQLLPTKKAGQYVIQATIQNDQAVNLEAIEYTAEITEQGSEQVIYQIKQNDYRMAPNSSTTLSVLDEAKVLQPAGKYLFHLTVRSKDTDQVWKWEEAFELPKEASEGKHDQLILYIVICTVVLLFLLIALLSLLLLRRRKQKQYEAELYQKKKKRKRRKKVQQNPQKSNEQKKMKRKKKHIPNNNE
jgi:hypothetical protein